MAHPLKPAESSAHKFGGRPEDYLTIHNWFDESKSFLGDFRHRAIRHHTEGIFLAERIFGVAIKNSEGKQVPVRYLGEQHDDDTEGRRAHDRGRLSLGDLGKMDAAGLANVRLFLTSRGDPVTPRMFRSDYWSPALRAAGIVAPPHIVRHWFVTNALRTIERTAANENEMVRRKTE